MTFCFWFGSIKIFSCSHMGCKTLQQLQQSVCCVAEFFAKPVLQKSVKLKMGSQIVVMLKHTILKYVLQKFWTSHMNVRTSCSQANIDNALTLQHLQSRIHKTSITQSKSSYLKDFNYHISRQVSW